MKYDCVVIGSGVSGLAAAIILAQNGKKTLIIEKNKTIAPLVSRFKKENVWCDPGFHYMGGFAGNGPMTTLFNYMGLADKVKIAPLPEDGYDIVSVGENLEFSFPQGVDNLREALCSRFPASAEAVNKYLDKVEHVNNATCFLNYALDYSPPPFELYADESLEAFLRKNGAEDELVELLGSYGYVLYGAQAHEIPLHIHAYATGSIYRGAATLKQSGDGLINAFKARLKETGADLLCGVAVKKINVDASRALAGLSLDNGESVECKACISTIHPSLLMNMLPENAITPIFEKRLKQLKNTFAPLVVFVDADEIPEKLQGRNVYHFKNSQRDFIGISSQDDSIASGEESAPTIFRPDETDYFSNPDDYVRLKRENVEKLFGDFLELYPELKNKCRIVSAATPLTYMKYTGTINGAIYGVRPSLSAGLSDRTPVSGLYMAGQSIKCPGIMGGITSALKAALDILPAQTVWKDIQNSI